MKPYIGKIFVIAYIVVCLLFFILKISGYHITVKAIEFFIIGIVISYPIVKFIKAKPPIWAKVVMAILIVGGFILVASNFFVLMAFGSESKQKIREWDLKNKKIILNQRQDWAGPPYWRYDLIEEKLFGLLNKTIAHSYYGDNTSDTCKVKFEPEFGQATSYEFDRCSEVLRIIGENGR